jgi:ribosomal protein S25
MGEALRHLKDKGLVQDALEELREALFAGMY